MCKESHELPLLCIYLLFSSGIHLSVFMYALICVAPCIFVIITFITNKCTECAFVGYKSCNMHFSQNSKNY